MLIIGHRGASGLAPENTLEAFQAGLESGADMLELDVRITKDGIPIVIHDSRLIRTHRRRQTVSSLTLDELHARTETKAVPTLKQVLDHFYGKILLNIELKSRGSAAATYNLVKQHYIKKNSDWDTLLFSSFKGGELVKLRKLNKRINLALLHDENPFIFVAYHRKLNLAAVGFHRLYVNKFALEIAKRLKIFVYVYTVNRPQAAVLLERQGIDGVVTNYPDKIAAEFRRLSD